MYTSLFGGTLMIKMFEMGRYTRLRAQQAVKLAATSVTDASARGRELGKQAEPMLKQASTLIRAERDYAGRQRCQQVLDQLAAQVQKLEIADQARATR